MGRPKTYERETVARKAMEVFWMHGFEAASIRMLTEHMGINRYSLFAEFNSKQELFEVAMARYNDEVVTRHFGRLEAPGAGLDELLAVFDSFAELAKSDAAEFGCFLTNVATERGPHDGQSRSAVQGYIERIERAVAGALSNAKRGGILAADVSVDDLSRLVTSSLLGLWVFQRARISPEAAAGVARAMRHILNPSPS
jgi:TetR/AcrR family transcriptional repressor of nem operon